MSSSQPNHHDAELVLKLYDLRRESLMREARKFIAAVPLSSVDDLLALNAARGTTENAYFRQVYGYWEMAAALIVHGTLNPLLAYDTLQEMYFVFAKIQPFLQEFREKVGMPDFLANVQRVVEGSAEGRERLVRMQKMITARARPQGASA